jgi:NAD(P)-dependent dehydrogenase (short-subunit alcohol dehydrogenase family)
MGFVRIGFMEKHPVALITGCSTGIGFETSLLLAQEGYRVFATLRDLKKSGLLRQAAANLPIEILSLDVDKPASVKKAVSFILKKTGRIDLLVNNAGWGAFGATEEFTDGEILAQYETNVFGLLRVTRAVLPVMRAQGAGRIINIGSLAGKMTFAGISLYCSTKYAVEAVTESLRLEVRPFNIQVALVEPGVIETRFKTNRRKAQIFLQGKSAYQSVMNQVFTWSNQRAEGAPGPEKVAGTILKALRARRMAIRYSVGFDAVWYPVAKWFLPDFFYDRLMRWMYARFSK